MTTVIFAPGLACLANIWPRRRCGGGGPGTGSQRREAIRSHWIGPLKLRRAANGFYYVNGTPTDCVHMAVTGMLDSNPTWWYPGSTTGPIWATTPIYSGTVAAATEGFLLGIPSIAISLVGKESVNYETAGKIAVELVQRFARQKHSHPWLFNVNVPDVPHDQLHGMAVTPWAKGTKPSRW